MIVVAMALLLSAPSCASCHPTQANPQPSTSMGHALEAVSQCSILQTHALLTFQSGPYRYRIEREGEESIYSVSDGQTVFSAPLRWAFGLGSAGQTYVYEKDGILYQSRVSYYKDIGGLDFTLGAGNDKAPSGVVAAAGQVLDEQDRKQCFGCHSTGTFEAMTPGIQCERCHGSAAEHVANKRAVMRKLGALTTEETSNFCGQCHRTWDQVASSGITGVVNVRFQPYRLTNSKCYDPGDARIRCTSCHDPHKEVSNVISNYDAKCLACHAKRVCKVATSNCISCHMPKVEIPGSHFRFTDHNIRIARAGAPYPD